MRFSQAARLACACALVFTPAVPISASNLAADTRVVERSATLPDHLPESSSAAAAEVETPEVETAQGAAGATTKKRPNLFVRIITAPFRGLARLFGGGKSDKTARVKTNDQQGQTQTTAATTTPAAETMSQQAGASTQQAVATPVITVPPVAIVPPVQPSPPAAAAKATDEAFDYVPRPFTPYIEGVAGDPLSQGRALLANGYTNEAIAELSIAAVTGPDLVEANNLLGLAYDRRGQHKQAQEFYERARDVAPQNASVLNNLGHSLYLDDRYKDALARLKEAARLAPADTRIAENLGLVYGRLRKYDDAFKQFKRSGGEFYARTKTGDLLARNGRDREAIKHYEAARKLNPASGDVLRQLITLYNRTGQPEKAEAAQRALDKTPTKQGVSASS